MTHREPSVLQVDVVSVESESVSGERNSIRVGDLVGGEWGAGAPDWARDRQWEGGVERPVKGGCKLRCPLDHRVAHGFGV